MTQQKDQPFYDRRLVPPHELPPSIKEWVDRMAREHGDDPVDVLTDLLLLAADDVEGAVMDVRELGSSPWTDQATADIEPEPPAAPEPKHGPQIALQASPAGAAS